MPHKGQVLTGVERLRISNRTRHAMQSSDVRQRMKDSFTPERRKQISRFHKRDAIRPERIAQSLANLPQTAKGRQNPNWRGGKWQECLYCHKEFWVIPSLLETAKYCSRECKDKALDLSEEANPNWRGGHYKNCEYCGTQFWAIPATQETHRYCSLSCKAKAEGTFKRLNADSKFQQKRLTMRKPNRQERKLEALLEKWFPGEWKFVGNGEVILEALNPDFINCNGRKQFIEFFGCWYHGCPIHHPEKTVHWQDTEIGKKVIFSRYGFQTLVIWEHELKDENAVIDKIVQFRA